MCSKYVRVYKLLHAPALEKPLVVFMEHSPPIDDKMAFCHFARGQCVAIDPAVVLLTGLGVHILAQVVVLWPVGINFWKVG